MSISVIFVIKNAIKNGYCFIEALQSCLPFADEIIISEGYSEDGTMDYLQKFLTKSKVPVGIYQDRWEDKSYVGEAITKVSEINVDRATCDWVYLLQADEIIHEKLVACIKNVSNMPQYNSVMFGFNHFIKAWAPDKNPAYKEAIRMVRRKSNPILKGDAWSFYVAMPVYASNFLPQKIFHFPWVFPKTDDIKHIEHSNIYQNIPEYQEKMRMACRNLYTEKIPYPVDPNYDDFPELAKRFVGALEYTLPEDYR